MLKRCLSILLLLAMIPAAGGAEMPDPSQCPEREELPDLMTFADGTPVETPEDWARRREEILALYAHYVYGEMPDPSGETVTWALSERAETPGVVLTVTVEGGELAGLGSACPYNERGYCGTETDTYFGEALAVVQAGESGRVELSVTDGTHSGSAVVDIVG